MLLQSCFSSKFFYEGHSIDFTSELSKASVEALLTASSIITTVYAVHSARLFHYIQGVSQLLKQSDWAQIQDFK